MATVTSDLVRLCIEKDGLRVGQLVREVTPDEPVEMALIILEQISPKLNAVVHRLGGMVRAQVAAGVPKGVARERGNLSNKAWSGRGSAAHIEEDERWTAFIRM